MSQNFSVLDMAQEYADANNIDVNSIFQQQSEKKPEPVVEAPPVEQLPKKNMWTPDAALTADMNELKQSGVVYKKDEIKEASNEPLKNMLEEDGKRDALKTMDDLDRKQANIEDAKKRHGIKDLQIPEGPHQVRIFAAAGDDNYARAQANLDELFEEIKTSYPMFIKEWMPGYGPDPNNPNAVATNNTISTDGNLNENVNVQPVKTDEIKVTVNKDDLEKIAWTEEEAAKIRKARTIELNIVEGKDISYSQITDIPDNAIDAVLLPYQRKVNDLVVSLPASKYRCTITGLSYTETLDLHTSAEMNNIDAERKKWSIAFEHIKNQNIGPWEEYKWYIDPVTKEKVKIGIGESDPVNIDPEEIHEVSKFEDFLNKTSFMDINFILWKVLCATSVNKEIITIDCHMMYKGRACNKTHDWVYDPNELLVIDNINPAVLEEMKITGEAAGKEDILKNYKTSMLLLDNVIELPNSKIKVVFGHVSAFDYLEYVFPAMERLKEMERTDPTISSRMTNSLLLAVIKGFIINTANGPGRITGIDNLIKVMDSLNNIDYHALSQLTKLMIEPYQFQYSIRNIVCPNCKQRSNIVIPNLARLIFIVAQSLDSVNVTLKRI